MPILSPGTVGVSTDAPVQAPRGRLLRVGPDRVVLREDRAVIHAAAALTGWEARSYRRTAILLEGRRCLLVRLSAMAGGLVRSLAATPSRSRSSSA